VSSSRIETIDWLKGIACLVMAQTHSLILLKPQLRTGTFYKYLERIDGLVAPAFIFSAGFALVLTLQRAHEKNTVKEQTIKSAKRILEVLAVATLVNLIWFHFWWRPLFIFRLDILHVIALALCALLGILYFTGGNRALSGSVFGALAMLIFFVSPFMESVRGPLQLFVNIKPGFLNETTGAGFSLFPWAGWVFLGGFLGTFKNVSTGALVLLVVGCSGWISESTIRSWYSAHDVWLTGPGDAARRLAFISGFIVVLRHLETRQIQMKWLTTISMSSLSFYFFHEMLLYENHVGIFSKLFRESLDWVAYWPVTAMLIAITLLTQGAYFALTNKKPK
jgi:uncharacterized membrane protein